MAIRLRCHQSYRSEERGVGIGDWSSDVCSSDLSAGMMGKRSDTHHLLFMRRWFREGLNPSYALPPLISSETAVTSCAGANGLVNRMLLGTPWDGHSAALPPVISIGRAWCRDR